MCREILIRTGFSFFIHANLERIRLLFQSAKFVFIRRRWDEIVFNIEDDSVEDELNHDFDIDFNPSASILFSSDYSIQRSKIDKDSLMIYRLKVQQECLLLAKEGYTDFIINYGCNYGIVALSELLYTKNNYNLNINLYYGKVMHEHASCVTKLDLIKIMQICHDYGVKHIEVLPPCDFIKKVICKVSRISSERCIIKTYQKIPESIYEHYKKLEQKVANRSKDTAFLK